MATPSPAEDRLLHALEISDVKRRPERVARIQWSSQFNLPLGVVAGPVEAMNLMREARECFVDGHFIATLLLATALIEHLIAERLVEAQFTKYGIAFGAAIEMAAENKLFSMALLERARALRVLRNPYAHRKPDEHPHTLGNRYISQKRHPKLVAEQDAQEALAAMHGFFTHVLEVA